MRPVKCTIRQARESKPCYISAVINASRTLLAAVLLFGWWTSLQPSLRLARWTPHDLMRDMGIPYHWILAYDHALPYVLHGLVGAVLVALVHFSAIFPAASRWSGLAWATASMLGLAVAAEGVQFMVGRGFDLLDILCAGVGALLVIPGLRQRDGAGALKGN